MKLDVLIVDDDPLNQLLLAKIVDQMGYEKRIAGNGLDAVEMFREKPADLVLMDIMMPELDGLQATIQIKQLANDVWVPIIMLSAMSEEDRIVAGLKAGADDYVGKPLQIDVLKAKLRHFEQSVANQRQLEAQNRELRRYQFETEDEKRIASHLMRSLVDAQRMSHPAVEWWLEPADSFSGDVLASATTPAGIQHLMLADGTGHGLAAALSAQPLPDIFYAMTARGFSIASIAQEINRRVSRMLPIDRFFAATLVAIDPRERMIEVWNGGNPPPMLLDPEGNVVHRFASRHLPLGILSNGRMSVETERYFHTPGAQLLIMSDGLQAAFPENMDEAMQAILRAAPPEGRLQCLKEEAERKLQGEEHRDDISLMLVSLDALSCDLLPQPGSPTPTVRSEEMPAWQCFLHLNGLLLQRKHQELLPMLMGLVEQLSILDQQKGQVFLVLSELLNNGLDHGLLKLESGLKQQGFDRYLDARAQGLESLQASDFIELHLEMTNNTLRLSVRDSGDGFDHVAIVKRIASDHDYHGRGLALVRSLCSEFGFNESGNTVRATVALSPG